MTTEERRRPAVGAQIKRWRTERAMTLANVAERSGLNVGYLSQIENDKASPSLSCLASIGDALDVPIAWFFLEELPAPTVVRAAERSVGSRDGLGRIERVDGNARVVLQDDCAVREQPIADGIETIFKHEIRCAL